MESYFDGIDNVFVHFDDKDGLYEGGQALSGTVKVLVKSATRIKEVKLYIQSKMRIKWIEVENGSNVPYEERDRYSQWLFPGSKSYKFSYTLPMALPYSLDGSKYGRIEYKAKAVVLMGNLKTSESMDEEFFLRTKLSLQEEAQIMAASKNLPLENVQYGRLGGGCFSKPFFLEVLLRLPRSVYYQGQMVRPEVEITLEKGNSQVEGVKVLLVQEMIYICNMDQEDEVRKKEVQVMGEWSSDDKIDQGESKKFSDIKILITKDLPITGFPHLDLIDVGYSIHAVAKTPSRFDDVIVKLPVTVMFGDESVWEEEERDRVIGNADVYGKSGEGEDDTTETTTAPEPETTENKEDDIDDGNENSFEEVGSDME